MLISTEPIKDIAFGVVRLIYAKNTELVMDKLTSNIYNGKDFWFHILTISDRDQFNHLPKQVKAFICYRQRTDKKYGEFWQIMNKITKRK